MVHNAQFGMIPDALRFFGVFDRSETILASPDLALWGVMLANI